MATDLGAMIAQRVPDPEMASLMAEGAMRARDLANSTIPSLPGCFHHHGRYLYCGALDGAIY